MQKHLCNNIKNMLPYLGLSIAVGVISSIIITVFKVAAEIVIHKSAEIYALVRENPAWLPLLVIGVAAVGFAASLILTKAPDCKGGGIPAAVAAVRGMAGFKWLASVFVLPVSALLTFLSGIPLGTEGPCVQMGTAIGEGVVNCLGGEKHKGWRRYVMTAGAGTGFSLAAASPVTAIVFSVEELQKKFSPLLLVGTSLSVITAQIMAQMFASLGIGSVKLFHMSDMGAISPKLLFVPLVIGIVCGVGSALLTCLHHLVGKTVSAVLKKMSVKVLFPVLFAAAAIIGFALPETLGTGHGLVDELLYSRGIWYMLLAVLMLRAVFMMASGTAGVTGGGFLPTLAFGAILGALCAEVLIALGAIQSEHYMLMVMLGVAAFLSANSRIPVTACVFAAESMGGINNVLPIIIAATVAYLIAHLSGVEEFSEVVIEGKVHAARKGKKAEYAEKTLTVMEGSVAAGKYMYDILWPDECTAESSGGEMIAAGDKITVRYKTYDPEVTYSELEGLVGRQNCHVSDKNIEKTTVSI